MQGRNGRVVVTSFALLWGAVVALLPALAAAHVGVGNASGFLAGLHHPISGADHVLAMLAVGVLAAQMGGRAVWALPGVFVTAMVFGGVLGWIEIPSPIVEIGIVSSVFGLGVLILGEFNLSLNIILPIIGFFALLHGYAHGSEMPLGSGGATYGIGLVFTTAWLHTSGIIAALLLQQLNFANIYRIIGSAIVCCGVYLVAT